MHRMNKARWARHDNLNWDDRAGSATRWGADAPGGRRLGREGVNGMEIKIIINEAGRGSVGRRPRHGRGMPMGQRGEGWRGGHHQRDWGADRLRGPRHEEATAGGGRVIGKLIETPDGRVRLVRRGMERDEQRHSCGHRHQHGETRHGEQRAFGRSEAGSRDYGRRAHSRWAEGEGEEGEGREAHRARRRLAREIVRALEESGYGRSDQA